MKNLAVFATVLLLMGSAACAQKGGKKGKSGEMKTEMDSISYIFGTSLGKNIRQSEIEGVDPEIVMMGVRDALESDSAMLISAEDGNNMVRAFMQKEQAAKGEKALKKANDYLAEKAKEEGIQSTESGILYEVVQMGEGAKPAATDKVSVHYEGKTIDGEVFDSSYERGQPAEFPLNRVIPGWTEILQMMPVGSTWIVTIPPSLAYGERGNPSIGPNEVLIFKIELLDIINEE